MLEEMFGQRRTFLPLPVPIHEARLLTTGAFRLLSQEEDRIQEHQVSRNRTPSKAVLRPTKATVPAPNEPWPTSVWGDASWRTVEKTSTQVLLESRDATRQGGLRHPVGARLR